MSNGQSASHLSPSRRLLLAGSLGLGSGILAAGLAFGARADEVNAALIEKAKAIHAKTLVLDPHVDFDLAFGEGDKDPRLDGPTQFDLPKLKRGGIGAIALALFVPQGPRTPEGFTDAHTKLETKLKAIKGFIAANPDQVEQALSPADVVRIHKAGKFAIILSFLNAYPLGQNLGEIDQLKGEGVRLFGFVHAGNNDFGDSSRPASVPAAEFEGLSDLGKQAVKKLNALGVIIDISQLTKKGALQTIALSTKPVIASHSGVYGRVPNPRNLSDEELTALAAKGGVINIVAFKPYLKPYPAEKAEEIKAIRKSFGLSETYAYPAEGSNTLGPDKRTEFSHALTALVPEAFVTDLIDSVDYAVKKIGIDHVGISSDFNHGGGVTGWANEGEAFNVTLELIKRGYSAADIAKLWGGNVLRVWSEVAKA